MAILTRPYYKKHGLFDPVYKNVFSDDDFTLRAKKNHAVIDARDLIIKHEHPHAVAEKPMDATYARGNQRSELVRAGSIFRAKHFPEVHSHSHAAGGLAGRDVHGRDVCFGDAGIRQSPGNPRWRSAGDPGHSKPRPARAGPDHREYFRLSLLFLRPGFPA